MLFYVFFIACALIGSEPSHERFPESVRGDLDAMYVVFRGAMSKICDPKVLWERVVLREFELAPKAGIGWSALGADWRQRLRFSLVTRLQETVKSNVVQWSITQFLSQLDKKDSRMIPAVLSALHGMQAGPVRDARVRGEEGSRDMPSRDIHRDYSVGSMRQPSAVQPRKGPQYDGEKKHPLILELEGVIRDFVDCSQGNTQDFIRKFHEVAQMSAEHHKAKSDRGKKSGYFDDIANFLVLETEQKGNVFVIKGAPGGTPVDGLVMKRLFASFFGEKQDLIAKAMGEYAPVKVTSPLLRAKAEVRLRMPKKMPKFVDPAHAQDALDEREVGRQSYEPGHVVLYFI